MSDIIDTTNQRIEAQLAQQIATQRSQKTEAQLVIDGTHYCIDCENKINPLRVKKMPDAPRCIDCQSLKEEKDKHLA